VPFPERLLAENEQVVAELHPHWSYLGWPLACFVGAVGLVVGVIVAFPHAPIALLYVLLAILAAAALWLAGRYSRRMTTTIFVTTARVVRRSGVLARSNLEIRLERINELSYHQSIAGRLLREGEVLVEVGGETGVVPLDHVPRPAELQSIISAQVSDWQRRTRAPAFSAPLPVVDTPPAGTPLGGRASGETTSVAERLVQLDELRRRGIVSAQEYETKKAQLLGEL